MAAESPRLDPADDALLDRFARADFPPGTFRHRDHVHVAWALVVRHEPLEALRRMDDGIRALAAANDAPDLYHRTVTWAYVLRIAERVATRGAGATFEEFAAANADLLDWHGAGLKDLYREETLTSPLAKRVFVMPDRRGGGGA
ncbi:MAG: hypothetical protein ACF8XB_25640 [Planctomycetota bacterium JB042]